MGIKQADVAMETEQKRRVEEALDEKEITRRVNIANKLLDVQKELLATHQKVKAQLAESCLYTSDVSYELLVHTKISSDWTSPDTRAYLQ